MSVLALNTAYCAGKIVKLEPVLGECIELLQRLRRFLLRTLWNDSFTESRGVFYLGLASQLQGGDSQKKQTDFACGTSPIMK